MGKIEALPNGAAETAPWSVTISCSTTECPGTNGAKCFFTPIGPIPGPPPP